MTKAQVLEILEKRIKEYREDTHYPVDINDSFLEYKYSAQDYLLNGPEGNDCVLRLVSAIEDILELCEK